MKKPLSLLLLVIAFSVTGILLGWLIGVSNSPVVAAILPLVFGLVGGFGFNKMDSRLFMLSKIKAIVKADEKDKEPPSKQEKSRNLTEGAIIFWSITIIAFCCSIYLGANQGIKDRTGEPYSLTQMISLAGMTGHQFSLDDRIISHYALLKMQAKNLSENEISDFFKHTLVPLLKDKEYLKLERSDRREKIIIIIDDILCGLEDADRRIGGLKYS